VVCVARGRPKTRPSPSLSYITFVGYDDEENSEMEKSFSPIIQIGKNSEMEK